jgi:hypothetical protein
VFDQQGSADAVGTVVISEGSGVEWGGVEWRGVEWSGVK